MNGSRSTYPRHGDRSSLDALNRTIEGLEARLEGLMQSRGEHRPDRPARAVDAAPAVPAPISRDPLQEIRDRQKSLAHARETSTGRTPPEPVSRSARPPLEPRRPHPAAGSATMRAASTANLSLHDRPEAAAGSRTDIKRDIDDGAARHESTLSPRIGSRRPAAGSPHPSDEMRAELQRLADGIEAVGHRAGPAADALRAEYEQLRAVVDGLAREETVRRLDMRWDGLEERLLDLNTNELREELVGLAYRIDDIKNQLGAVRDSPAIRALEQKLLTVATAVEQLGSHIQPNDIAFKDQFALLDDRLDEISRAIAASGRGGPAPAMDQAALERLENRIGSLAQQIDAMAVGAGPDATRLLSDRIEDLSERVGQLADDQIVLRLEERIEHLSAMLESTPRPQELDLTDFLAEISEKIDRLEGGASQDLIERLDRLARRIEEIEYLRIHSQPATDPAAFERIEDRLSGIAARLDETARSPVHDSAALQNLEAQIAHLSSLMSDAGPYRPALPEDIGHRMAALEDHLATNDEYILEAARQAAEAVVESFSRHGQGGGSAMDMAAVTALAEDLRHLEELTRSSEERSQHTLNALHSTLVQIADRLDAMEDRIRPPMMGLAETAGTANHSRSAATSFPVGSEPAERSAAGSPHQDLMQLLASGTAAAPAAQPMPAEPTADRENPKAAQEQTAEDTAVAPDIPMSGTTVGDRSGSGRSILGQITKRLMPGQKPVAAKSGRIVVDPAPSLDPVDILPAEQENEPLEPGSGTPDVRKILERVRASQAKANSDRKQPGETDRTDYIAAARRAAKAAAMETDPAAMSGGTRKKTFPAKPGSDKSSAGTALARYRRPIMMAAGAVLLVLMTMPLVRTLTVGEQAPPATIEAPPADVQPAENADADAAPESAATAQPEAAAAAPVEELVTASEAALDKGTPESSEETTTAEESPIAMQAADAQAAATTDTPTETAEAPPAAELAPRIVVPASIGPKSLAEAAEAGDAIALFEIGARYTDGRGVTGDLSEAANWYKLAADRGFAPAQYRLASLFEKGTGITRDIDKAMTYYRQAAEAGNASAMHNLAVLYASGANGEPDYASAVEWFGKAADLGVSDSQFNLAILYARGNGASQNLVESYKWFAIAAKGGDQDAAAKRDEVAKAMRKDQVQAAQLAADSWKPQPLDSDANEVRLPDEWAGGKPLTTASVDMERAVLNIQAILNKNGFDAGTPDGKMGPKTVEAIKTFQTSIGQEPTGKVNDALVKELLKRNS
ncbi:hemagglutinin [Pseudorhizobium endolithicum]|uniref:Hemagglutinin n=1 Tax=Pseudorhizobium endolithicum TaxID=1191678 RepID=A0ABM8PKF9_9HYPH|nr:peptidoglycan-binding protein [Pseudorhizobium endolithicum]CAD7034846.1 hemagglutinin [Pseudorhizobium endolithicum]